MSTEHKLKDGDVVIKTGGFSEADKTLSDTVRRRASASLYGTLLMDCEYCGEPGCDFSCDESSSLPNPERDEIRNVFNVGAYALERILLYLAVQGVDLTAINADDALDRALSDLNKHCKTKITGK
jgi:hypothetical protein